MSKLTQASRGQACTIRLPMVCNANPETVVGCHLAKIRFGHGVGQKVDDVLIADGCSSCHDVVDGRVKVTHLTWEEIYIAFLEGVLETILRRRRQGLL
jgi:hypothetical protein